MCGICGEVNFKTGSRIDENVLRAMNGMLSHRGPDDEGYYVNNNASSSFSVGLGHRRLAIIDLNTGHQPIHNEDSSIWVVHNGEIYNFMELAKQLEAVGHVFYTRSDAEVIVHAYEEYGENFLEHFRGMFAFALWDGRQKKLILARDRVGKKPLLYAILGNKLIFASEFNALLAHPEIDKTIDIEAVHHFLTYLCIPAPFTIFKKIKKLPAANMLVFKDGNAALSKYWDLDYSKKIKITEEDAACRIIEILKEATRLRLVSDVPLGVLLSGGIDSSCITALISRIQTGRINTFSVGFGEGQFNELPYAGLVADYFKTEHHEDYVTPNAAEDLPQLVKRYGEPYADSSALPTYYVCRAARKKVKVALNGDGGDEVFGGYRRHLANHLAEAYGFAAKAINRTLLKKFFERFPARPSGPNSFGSMRRFLDAAELDRPQRYMQWIGFFDESFKRALYTDEFNRKTQDFNSGVFLKELFDKTVNLDAVDAALYTDIFFGLQADLTVKMDIASMANSLETRSPMLDQSLMEFSAALPSSFKVRNFSLKCILKKSLKDIVPDEILKRPKKGFAVPVDAWFRGPLKGYLVDTILSDRSLSRGYFRPDRLKGIIESHMSCKNDYGQHLWGLLVLELWHRMFIDGEKP